MSKRSKDAKEPSEGDIIANKLNLLQADKRRKLFASLGSADADYDAKSSTLDDDEDEDFGGQNAGFEQLGVGGRVPKDIEDGTFRRRTAGSTDKLLEQLMGKKAAKAHLAAKQAPKDPKQQQFGKHSRVAKKEESEDEEEGRASAFKSKRRKVTQATTADEDAEDNHNDAQTSSIAAEPSTKVDEDEVKSAPPRSKKAKPTSFLDEILAERSKKKKGKGR